MSEFEMNNSDSDDDLLPTLTDLPKQLNEIFPPISYKNEEDKRKVIPVTILTGFLGSGKSCLLNHILTADHGKKIAVIENEFSSGLGIESMIVQSGVDGSKSEGFFELNNGCICCTVKDDLLLALEQLVRHKDKFDYLIIETTGVANPGPVISSLWTDEDLESSLKIDGVVCIVDSINILTYLETSDIANDVRMQICYSDRILLNKSDIVTPQQLDEVEKEVCKLNSIAQIKRTSFSKVNLDWVLDLNSYDMTKLAKIDFINNQGLITGDMCVSCGPNDNNKAIFNQIEAKHSANSLTTFGFDFIGKVDLLLLNRFLDKILYGNKNSKETESISTIHKSYNDSGGSSSSVYEMKIFRMKGILHVADSLNLYILQSVHDLFDVQESSIIQGASDDTTNGNNRIILIGRNMNREYFEEGFKNCIINNNNK